MCQALKDTVRQKAAVKGGMLSWAEYVEICLFEPKIGYYAKAKKRVGKDGADFYTSVSLRQKVFSELFAAAVANYFKEYGQDAADFKIVEIGAEPDTQIIKDSPVIRLGQKIEIPQSAAVVSNELLDAQPFERFKFDGGKWQKSMLDLSNLNFSPREFLCTPSDCEKDFLQKYFPRARVEGFNLDISFSAHKMLSDLCRQDWRGAIFFADYFRSAAQLSEMPQGTARTYRNHKDGREFFEHIGDTDITFSPCSDVLIDILKENGFLRPSIDTQQNFFMKYAAEKIRQIIENPDNLDPRKRELCQLISPAYMGSCFEILSAARF